MKYIFLAQIGTPKDQSIKEIRQFLKEFLKNRRVVDLNPFFWKIILYLFILPFRPSKVQKKYLEMIKHLGFNPTLLYTKNLAEILQTKTSKDTTILPYYIFEKKLPITTFTSDDELLIVPMFPQYSESTWALVFDQLAEHMRTVPVIPSIKLAQPFFRNPKFIEASVKHIQSKLGDADALILTFHSYPKKRILKKHDPYHEQCIQTFEAIKASLAPFSNIQIAYHSKFGKGEWLNPTLEDVVKNQIKAGSKKIAIHSPAFLIDSLETSFDIGIELANKYPILFISCLNDSATLYDVIQDLAVR